MHTTRPTPLLALALVALAAALTTPLAAQTEAPALPSVTLPAELDRVLRDYETAWAAGDAEGLAALFTEDGFVLSGRDPHIRGRAAIRERYRNAGGELRLRAVAFEASGDVGYIIGAYRYEEPVDRGKFVLALKRVGERWYIAADMDASIQR